MPKNGYEYLTPLPFWSDLVNYRSSFLRRDLVAAISVALLALPQSMAYAFLAGLPLTAGIFAAFFGTIFTAFFGASKVLISGPTNTAAILIQSGTAQVLTTYYPNIQGDSRDILAIQIVFIVTMMVGIFQIVAGLVQAGRITQFASRSVVMGYMAAVSLAIIVSQAYPFLGIKAQAGYFPLIEQIWFLLTHLFLLNIPTLIIGAACLVLLIWLTKKFPRIPGAVIVFLLAGIIVGFFRLSPGDIPGLTDIESGERIQKVTLLEDVGSVKIAIPEVSFPTSLNLTLIIELVPLAFAVALLTILEVTSIGRNYHKAIDPPYSSSQEVFGLGMSNFLSSFLGAMPSSGSFSRTSLNVSMGAKTRFSAVFSGVFLFVIILLFGFIIGKIPLTALAALMLLTAYMMINFRDLLLCIRTTRIDAMVVFFTFLGALFFNLDIALYIGVILSIVLYLRQAAIPRFIEYSFNNQGKLRPLEIEEDRLDPRICIVQAEGELFFGAADILQMKLREYMEDETLKVIIFQLLNIRSMDASICLALHQLIEYLKSQNKTLLISGVTPEVAIVIKKSGLFEEMGKDHVFFANEKLPSEPTRSAYAFAKSIINSQN